MFSKAIVRSPGANYAEGLTTARLGPPKYGRALKQHAAYCEALEQCGLKLTHLEPDEKYPDSTFVEDTAVIVKALHEGRASAPRVMLARPGATSRMGEVQNIKTALSESCSELDSIRDPGTLDGGDVCEAEAHFFIGISERTNETGAQQLADFVASCGYSSSFVDIRGVENILHLKSGLAYLGDNRLAVIDGLAGLREFQGYELVRVAAEEEYAANCVRVNDRVLVAEGYPRFEQMLRDLGYQTIALALTEFQKMDGGLSCLSLRL